MTPTYFYRVDEFVATSGRGERKEESFSHSLDFHFDSLAESKKQAYEYYTDRLLFLAKESDYFLPFTPATDASPGLIAAYSLTLYFVECYDEEEYYLYGLEGVDDDEKRRAGEIEAEVFAL